VKTKLIGSRRLKKKDGSVKTRLEAKPTVMNTVFLDLRTSIEDCEKVIKAFKKLGYTTYYDSKTKTLKTTAPKTRIKEFSKLFKCIQSYSLIQKLK
jgi:adenylate cyclase class IV